MAARHLLAHGHRKIALLDGPWGHLPCAQRRDGFLEEMLAAGAAPIVIDAIGWDRAFTARSARRALADTAARPTAVVIYGDRGTAGLFDVVLEMGIEVPRDLAVIAVDIPNSALDAAPVPLTAFVPDYTGYAIAIDDALTNHKSGSIVVPDRFVVGRTCGCVPIRHDLDLMNAQSFSLAIP
jgi:LacI family transcriptional regulator